MKQKFFLFITSVILLLPGCYNYTKGQSAICELHHEKMKKEVLSIRYGLIKDFSHLQTCPNGRNFIAGGCVVRSPKLGIAYSCNTCRKLFMEK